MTKSEIKEYLENYRDKKTVAEFKIKQGETESRVVKCIKGLEDCLESLPDGLGDILRQIYFDGKSIRKISDKVYCSRMTLARKRDKAIDLMAVCLSEI